MNIKITKEKILFDNKTKLSNFSFQLYKLDENGDTDEPLFSFGDNEIDDMLQFIANHNLNIVKFVDNTNIEE